MPLGVVPRAQTKEEGDSASGDKLSMPCLHSTMSYSGAVRMGTTRHYPSRSKALHEYI